MPTKADLRRLTTHIKPKVRKGDQVMIIAGKDKGQVGFIAALSPKEQRVIVLQDNPENPDQPIPLNAAIKHARAKRQGERSARIRIPVSIHISNVQVIDPESEKPTRVGRRLEDGKLVRYAKKSGKTLVDAPNIDKKD